jgi:hypothetical protein
MKKLIFSILLFVFLMPFMTYGEDDLFQVKTPNVMIIFDTSSSMNMDPSGNSVSSHKACIDANGKLQTTNLGHPPCTTGYTSYNFESGGNHPDSKLYQAKLALKEIIQDVVGDKVNLGFSTYAQFKTDIKRGRYVRNRVWLEKYYWAYYQTRDYRESYSPSPNSFTDVWGASRSGISVGSTFTRPTSMSVYQSGMTFPPHPSGPNLSIPANTMNYTVYNITYQPEYNRYRFRYRSDLYWWYRNRIFTIDNQSDCGTDTAGDKFPATWVSGGITYYTYFAGQPEYVSPTGGRAAGFWSCTPRSKPTEYSWRQYTGTTCPATDGVYTLVPGTCYDYSNYYYPADGLGNPPNKPHTWSYFKMSGSNWPESGQLPNYYPATYGSTSFINDPGLNNNHFFF